jgi:SSS family solute:Na+ symporter
MSERRLVYVGRLATGVVVVLGILWIPIMPLISDGGLYQYLQSVQGYLAPPITAVFLLGLCFPRINAQGALTGLVVGFILGMLKLTLQALVGGEIITGPAFIVAFGEFNFLYYSGVLLLVSVVVIVAVSLATPAQDRAMLAGLTYGSVTPEQKAEEKASIEIWDILGTIVVLGLVLGIYLYFSFWI